MDKFVALRPMTLPPISQYSMRGWLLNAAAPAPLSPRKLPQGNGESIAALFAGSTDGWASTASSDFLGMRPKTHTMPFSPRPAAKLLESGERVIDRYRSTANAAFADPGRSPREVRKIYSNAPSEADHPMFGLHDPFRKERLGPMMESSQNASAFLKPDRRFYSFSPAAPPYPDTAQHSFTFDARATIGSHQTEQQSKYAWPATLLSPRRVKRPESTLVIA